MQEQKERNVSLNHNIQSLGDNRNKNDNTHKKRRLSWRLPPRTSNTPRGDDDIDLESQESIDDSITPNRNNHRKVPSWSNEYQVKYEDLSRALLSISYKFLIFDEKKLGISLVSG